MIQIYIVGEILPSIYIHAHVYIFFSYCTDLQRSTVQYTRDANIEPLSAKQKLRVHVTVTMVSDMFLRT